MDSEGWVPVVARPGCGPWSTYQESLHLILLASPTGPTGVRLRQCLMRCDPRSVVALADIIREACSGG
ncbi:conserved hypothetical protein [Frankia sp. AgKG'84/4]